MVFMPSLDYHSDYVRVKQWSGENEAAGEAVQLMATSPPAIRFASWPETRVMS